MHHLKITIDIPVSEQIGKLSEAEAKEAAKQAYISARKAIINWTQYNENDYTFEIED